VTDIVVKLDIYPATALLPGGSATFYNTRLTVADDRIQLWRMEGQTPVVVFTRPLGVWTGNIRTGYEFTVDDGVLTVGKGDGCACGAQLATAQLWPGSRRINTTL
jgi:hypothetical protein